MMVSCTGEAPLLDEFDFEGLIQISARALKIDEEGPEVAARGSINSVCVFALSDDLVEVLVRERRAVLVDRLDEDGACKLEIYRWMRLSASLMMLYLL